MGDLPGSPSVAPSPLFCTALWGEGAAASLATAPTLLDGAELDCVGVRGLPSGAGGDKSVVNTAARGREEPRRCLHRSRQCPRWSSSFFSFLVSSCVFLLPGEGRCSRGPGCRIQRRPEKWQSHPAPCGAAEERRANAGSVCLGSSVPGGCPPLPHGPAMSVEEGEGA
jgi:hypothetical protein